MSQAAALDAAAEYEIFSKFLQLTKGWTAILISHRFRTVKAADCIYVMDSGRISESGSHDELQRKHGIYESIYLKQTANFE